MKKLRVIALGLSCVGILSFGVNNNSSQGYAYGDYPVPQRPDLAYSDGNTGGSPSYSHGHTGGSPAENRGDTWSPAYSHGNTGIVSNEAEGDTPVTSNTHGETI